jgi:hypothetical protein
MRAREKGERFPRRCVFLLAAAFVFGCSLLLCSWLFLGGRERGVRGAERARSVSDCERAPRDARGGNNKRGAAAPAFFLPPAGATGAHARGPVNITRRYAKGPHSCGVSRAALLHNAALCSGDPPRLPRAGVGGRSVPRMFCVALTARALRGPRCICTPRDGSEEPGARCAQRG